MHVREIKNKDCNNLSALSIYVWLDTYAIEGIRDKISDFALTNFTPKKFKRIVNSQTQKGFVVISKEHVIGVVIINSKSNYNNSNEYGYEIETLYVHPSFQRQGVGKLLLLHLEKTLGKKSWLTTWVHNYSAIEFYKNNGFKIIGETKFNLFDEVHLNHVLSNS